ncbi:MAG: hypothetical protein ACI4V1_01060 [Eubacteriales bacterium]
MNDSPLPIRPRTMSRTLFLTYVLLAALLLTIFLSFLTAALIRGIDDFLYRQAEPDFVHAIAVDTGTHETVASADRTELLTFAEIFSALDSARLEVHVLVPALLAFAFTFGVGMLLRGGRQRGGVRFVLAIVLAVPVGLALFAVSLVVSVLLTEVNDIRFGTILWSLWHHLDALSGVL